MGNLRGIPASEVKKEKEGFFNLFFVNFLP